MDEREETKHIEDLEFTLDIARNRIAEMKAALKPFAVHADAYHSHDGQHDFLDSDEITLGAFKCTVGDLRTAQRVMNKV